MKVITANKVKDLLEEFEAIKKVCTSMESLTRIDMVSGADGWVTLGYPITVVIPDDMQEGLWEHIWDYICEYRADAQKALENFSQEKYEDGIINGEVELKLKLKAGDE
jgi:hypothetical protein|tara:strand:- start:14684 stop:15007 length:324 start_codon:yes stop_codon:yes gene_type:complete